MTKDELTKLRQERRGQRLNIGDRVKAYDRMGNLLYGGKTAVIAEKALLVDNEYYFGIYVEGVTDIKRDCSGKATGYTSFFAPFYAENLELVNEPKTKRDSEADEAAELERVKTNCKELYEAGMNFCRAILGEDAVKEPTDEDKPESEPTANVEGIKVGDRVKTAGVMGTAKIVSGDGDYVVSRLDDGGWEISMNFSLPEKEEQQPAEEIEEKEPKYGTITIPVKADIDDSCYEALRIELAKEVAIAYAEKGRYEPSDIGAKAVEVANGVINKLKNERK